ncbi:MAG: NAD(P)H-dependent oxidoreductase [Actinobacteria bacterium]|nr:NAD(P)H-dependent oxidoreductase [Actinomycetota bacterium]
MSTSTTTRVLLICGSLQTRSTNRASLAVVGERLTTNGAIVRTADWLGSIKPFNLDYQDDPGDAVVAFRTAILEADAVVVATPEYAAAIPGMLKNALDWVVGTGELYSKPIAVVSAGTTGGEHARNQLVRSLMWQGGHVVASLAVASPLTKSDADGWLTDQATIANLNELADTIEGASQLAPTARRRLIDQVASAAGVEPGHVAPIPGE